MAISKRISKVRFEGNYLEEDITGNENVVSLCFCFSLLHSVMPLKYHSFNIP